MPLVIPYQNLIFRILALDPGTDNTGVAIYEIDYYTLQPVRIEAFTLQNDRIKVETGIDPELYGERYLKLRKLRVIITELLQKIQPVHVVCESPFYNRFRPMAYGALLELLAEYKGAVVDYNPNVAFTTIAPILAKSVLGAGATKGKLDVKRCLKAIPEITSICATDLDTTDEHSDDAIGIGYTYIKRVLNEYTPSKNKRAR